MTTTRQLVLLCDGTNNQLSGGHADTHVVRLAELLHLYRDPDRIVYYDPGVGAADQLPGTTATDRIRRRLDRINGLAFGRGLYDNVAEGYQFLMDNWQRGDQVFIFGFSRGAFTARSIGGLVNAYGIVDRHKRTLVPSLVSTYFAQPTAARQAVQQQVARMFAQGSAPAAHWPVVHFAGMWDTVASVGLWPFDLRITATPTLDAKQFRHVRQALALDEQRAQFMPRVYAQHDGAFRMRNGDIGDVAQCWFRGAHCDVGGGYPYPRSEQARAPFAWMVDQARCCGLRLPAVAPHAALASEQDVLDALPRLDPPRPQRGPACLASQPCAQPLWALTGLQVRDTAHAVNDGRADQPVTMQAHPSVTRWAHRFPDQTAWGQRWSGGRRASLVAALAVLLWCALQAGWALQPPAANASAWEQIAGAAAANLAFLFWQLGLPPAMGAARGVDPATALWLDVPLIAAYMWLLSHLVSRAFARCAGLIQVGEAAPRWLNRAGWALPLAVLADAAEDLLTALVLWLPDTGGITLCLVRVALALATAAKTVCLLGCVALVLSGLKPRR
jgi:uncharacterized protein (DUF2235 family)